MQILYLSASYVPSRRASSIQVMKMCQALARNGHQVTLVTKECASRQEPGILDDFSFYGVEPNFEIIKLPRPEHRGGGVLYTYGQWQLLRQWVQKRDALLVYSRDLWGGWLAVRQGFSVVFEAHGMPDGDLSQRLMRQMINSATFRRLVVISQALADDFAQIGLWPADGDVVVAHDGAEGGVQASGRGEANGRVQIGYVGHLYSGKGMEMVTALAGQMSDQPFHVIGGTDKDIRTWQASGLPANVTLHGFVSPPQLAVCYQNLDILLLPPQPQVYGATGSQDISRWMSPMKLFEYMAAGKAIVSSDLPVLREVLTHERNALLVAPDDVKGWVTAVTRLINDPDLRQRLGQTARQDLLAHYTWEARAHKVLDGL
ncbi:MAG TPA: glycosyltransferase family 4 protein [Chloroflexota bacterium]|nr:glycosyltransferase family 4 protein [Chloroflexota bacterium]HUM67761.1 glycosyltransferase family 4 protein [Chloroflexota bacterium]